MLVLHKPSFLSYYTFRPENSTNYPASRLYLSRFSQLVPSILSIMSSSSSEKANLQNLSGLEAQRTNDTSQPGMPMYHRRLANPAPLGLLSFATSVFLVSLTGLGTRGVEAPNIIVTTMIFFGGICQYIAGIMEFCLGNTVRTTKNSGPTLTTESTVWSYGLLIIRRVQRCLCAHLHTWHRCISRLH